MVKVLLSAEPDLDARDDRYGSSLLHLAASRGNFKAVQGLLDAGANPNARDKDGWTPLHLVNRERIDGEPDEEIKEAEF